MTNYRRVKAMGANPANRPGSIITQVGWQGVNYVDDPGVMEPYQVPFAQNVDFSNPIGAATKRQGLEKLFASLGAGAVRGLHTFKHSSGNIMLMAHGNDLYQLADDETPAITKSSKEDWDAGTKVNIDTDSSPGVMKLTKTLDFVFPPFIGDHVNTVVGDGGGLALVRNVNLDPDTNTLLLMHFNGFNGSTNFIDTTEKAVVTYQQGEDNMEPVIKLSSKNKKFGYAGCRFSGGGDLLMATLNKYSRDFTIDFWIQANPVEIWNASNGAIVPVLGSLEPYFDAITLNIGLFAEPFAGGFRLRVYVSTFGVEMAVLYPGPLNYNPDFVHIAVVRQGSDVMLFINGALVNTGSYVPAAIGEEIFIGSFPGITPVVLEHAYIDELRISNIARWTEAFTPPTAEYPYNEYPASGVWTSGPIDISQAGIIESATTYIDGTIPEGAFMEIGERHSLDGGDTWVNPDWNSVISGYPHPSIGVNAYQLRARLYSELGKATPVLNSLTLRIVSEEYFTGASWLSPIYDLGNTPKAASLAWNQGEGDPPEQPEGTSIAISARASLDGTVWGDWKAILSDDTGLPIGRYLQIKIELSGTSTETPVFSDFTINYSTGFTSATKLDLSPLGRVDNKLTGNRVRFVSYNNKCYCADGLRPFIVYVEDDALKVRKAGVDPPATAPTIAEGAGTGITGKYYAKVTFVNEDGVESNPSAASSELSVSNKDITWTVPTGPDGTASRRLYRTKANGLEYFFVDEIEDNTTTTFTDAVPDTSLELSMLDDNNIPPENATIVYEYLNYMLYANNLGELWFSKVGSPEQVPNNGEVAAVKTFVGPILAIGDMNSTVVVHGEDYVSVITGGDGGFILDTDPEIDTTRVRAIDKNGALSHESVAICVDPELRNIMVFPTKTGVRFLLPGIQEQSLESVPLSRNIQPYYDASVGRFNLAGCFHNNRYLLSFSYQAPGSEVVSTNNILFVYDFRNKQWTGPWTIGANCFAVSDADLYCGSPAAGIVYRMFTGNSDDGEDIEMIFDPQAFSPEGEQYWYRFRRFLAVVSADSDTTDTIIKPKVDDAEMSVAIGKLTSSFTGDKRPGHDLIRSRKYPIILRPGNSCGFRVVDDSTNHVSIQKLITEYETIRLKT